MDNKKKIFVMPLKSSLSQGMVREPEYKLFPVSFLSRFLKDRVYYYRNRKAQRMIADD
jgi:hypothetical protein